MITRKIFNDLAIFMMGFGIIIGIVFPFFVLITGTPSDYVLTPLFFTLCMLAGAFVGLFNVWISRKIVGSKIKKLAQHMKKVQEQVESRKQGISDANCQEKDCYITIQSEDEIGDSAHAFNALVQTLSQSYEAEDYLRTFTELTSSNLELDKLAQDALNMLISYTKANAGAILLETDGNLNIISNHAIINPEALLVNDQIWKVIANRKRVFLDLPEDIKLDGFLVEYQPKTVLIEPILHKGIALGVLILSSINKMSPDHIKHINMYAQNLALALKNAISHNQLQRLAAIDPLTNILNRRFGYDRLKDELTRAIKNQLPLGILLFDIDHFKKINDTYGHIIGDKVLINLSKAVKTVLREGDIFYRYGGEEFIVVLPGASKKDV